MGMTVIPIIIDVLRKVTKRLDRRLKELKIWGRIEIIQTTANKVEYSEESWIPGETCCRLNSNERSSADASVRNLQ